MIKFLKNEDIQDIIMSIKGEKVTDARDIALIETLFSTGLRISEALSLFKKEFEDIDVNKTFEMSIVGKGKKQRVIFFSPSALNAIQSYLKICYDKSNRLFPITSRRAQVIIKKRADYAGYEGVTPHKLRHSMAVEFLNNGVSLYHIQQFLGHSSLSSTAQYLHVTNKELSDIHKKIYN